MQPQRSGLGTILKSNTKHETIDDIGMFDSKQYQLNDLFDQTLNEKELKKDHNTIQVDEIIDKEVLEDDRSFRDVIEGEKNQDKE